MDAEIKNCPFCKEPTKGWFPSNLKGPLQYGHGIKVFVINLFVAQMVSLNRVQKLVQSLLGRAISEATILRYVLNLYNDLERWEEASIEALLKTDSMHCDETSMKVKGGDHWIHA